MEERINKTVKYLQAEYIMIWILPIVLVILYETGIMTEGDYAGDARMDYILQTIGILLTVGLIPLSLRLFSLSLVKCVKLLSLWRILIYFVSKFLDYQTALVALSLLCIILFRTLGQLAYFARKLFRNIPT